MLIGRKNELAILNRAFHDDNSHFVAVYGRRRIGKTFLVRECFDYRFTFQHSGVADKGMDVQLQAFNNALKEYGYDPGSKLKNWMDAFEALKSLIRNSTEKRKVIFIDELSWMDTRKSDLISALEHFWNSFASARKDIVLIVCASATSWMLSNVIHNKGGLYNRLTEQINLKQFTLAECELLTKARGLVLDRSQILQAYMAFGGVPYYWTLLERGMSVAQNIDRLFFADDALLKNEYDYLYASIFRNPQPYQQIIEALAGKKVGMTRDEIISATGMINSGAISRKLDELESCGFIRKYYAFGMKKKNAVYQLMDCFTLFYFKHVRNGSGDSHFWSNNINTSTVNVWMGLAFERVCMLHIDQIKNKLGISGVSTEINSWYCKADPDKGILGSQIDLLIVRKDQIINLCEIKYSGAEYIINAATMSDINRKMSDFVNSTSPKYAIHTTLITPLGLVDNKYSGNIQTVITAEDLFA